MLSWEADSQIVDVWPSSQESILHSVNRLGAMQRSAAQPSHVPCLPLNNALGMEDLHVIGHRSLEDKHSTLQRRLGRNSNRPPTIGYNDG